MEVIKALNNSQILSRNDEGVEVILMGKGLGFSLKKGDCVPEEKIEKVFKLDSISQTLKSDYIQLFEDMPENLLLVVKEIVDYTNKQYENKLNKNLFFTLLDHINYAIERSVKGIVFQNKLLVEIQRYYPKEFTIGRYAVERLNLELKITLPEEEAGNIAFHIVNAQDSLANMEETILSIRMLKDILMLLGYLFPEKEVDKESFLYLRFVTHLQFFIGRMLKREELPAKDDFLLNSVKVRLNREFQAAQKVKEYVENELNVSVNSDELLYLTLHIARVY
jgi:beta-glucoside operon transcriptional antiterminator